MATRSGNRGTHQWLLFQRKTLNKIFMQEQDHTCVMGNKTCIREIWNKRIDEIDRELMKQRTL